ncbi:MAG: hypothetical protein C0600_08740 [Ignavibacteria bacterium]|nr:MAG: hypothetical protein C0600_08740 [Ignavibacteria bacterium]
MAELLPGVWHKIYFKTGRGLFYEILLTIEEDAAAEDHFLFEVQAPADGQLYVTRIRDDVVGLSYSLCEDGKYFYENGVPPGIENIGPAENDGMWWTAYSVPIFINGLNYWVTPMLGDFSILRVYFTLWDGPPSDWKPLPATTPAKNDVNPAYRKAFPANFLIPNPTDPTQKKMNKRKVKVVLKESSA